MNAWVLSRQFEIDWGLAVLAEANAALQFGIGSSEIPFCKQGKAGSFVGKRAVS